MLSKIVILIINDYVDFHHTITIIRILNAAKIIANYTDCDYDH